MENIYVTNYSAIREAHRENFDALERAQKLFGVEFFLIGGQGRDVWIKHHILDDNRITSDIDFSVMVPDQETWNKLVHYLLTTESFTRDNDIPYRFYHFGMLHLIPFGGIEENGKVLIQEPDKMITVSGFQEAAEYAEDLEGPFRVVTLPGLCIMKLLSYHENPDTRAQDWDDFVFLLLNYMQITAGDQLLDDQDDLISDDMDLSVVAARVLGRNMGELLIDNEWLRYKVLAILQKKLNGLSPEEIDRMYQADEDDEQSFMGKLVKETMDGIIEEHEDAQETSI